MHFRVRLSHIGACFGNWWLCSPGNFEFGSKKRRKGQKPPGDLSMQESTSFFSFMDCLEIPSSASTPFDPPAGSGGPCRAACTTLLAAGAVQTVHRHRDVQITWFSRRTQLKKSLIKKFTSFLTARSTRRRVMPRWEEIATDLRTLSREHGCA